MSEIPNERRQECLLHRRDVEDLRDTVFGKDANSGLKYKFITISTKLNIFITLQALTLVAVITAVIRVIFYPV